jgi:tetratricopeptide (TPR) repeat protein
VKTVIASEQVNKTEPQPPKPPPVVEEEYVRDCLRQQYEELPETRYWNDDPAFRRLLDPLNSGNNVQACSEAESLIPRFSDFADLYVWWGEALLRMGSLDKARQVLRDGLGKTKQKYPLCNLLGKVEWKALDIRQAVYWWAQGMHCQESLAEQNYGNDVGAYLYLYYVAEGIGLSDCSSALLTRVDQIRPGMVRLSTEMANDLSTLSRTARSTSASQVLQELVSTHIVPKRKGLAEADSAEIDRLIRQLEERDSLGYSSVKNVEAAKRLGELGDPRALEPLTRAMRDLSLALCVAAEEAVRRIRQANR